MNSSAVRFWFLAFFIGFGASICQSALFASRESKIAAQEESKSDLEADSEANSELEAIRKTLNEYIVGSTQGQPDRLRNVFAPELNLYSVKDNSLQIWSGKDYIRSTKQGVPTGERGRILAISVEHDIAVAKVEIAPERSTGPTYVDYFMLLRFDDQWKIVHKMYTRRGAPMGESGEWAPTASSESEGGGESQSTDNSQATRQDHLIDDSQLGSAKLVSKVDTLATEMLTDQHVPGMALVVVHEGKTIIKRGYGLANVSEKTPVDPDQTRFRIGSISKALTLLTLTRLVDQGQLEMTTSVEPFVSSISNPHEFESDIKVNHLLTHTSGLDQIGTFRQIREHDKELSERLALRSSLIEFLEADNLRRCTKPGEMFRYDTYGSSLAGVIIASQTGLGFADAMQQEFFQPLGMMSSSVDSAATSQANLAVGYGFEDGQFQPQPYEVYLTTPASSIDSTAADMGKFLEALTSDGSNSTGRFLSEERLEAIAAGQFRSHPNFCGVSHGLFESFTSTDFNTVKHVRILGHGGNMQGYRAALTWVPEHHLGIFIVANRSPDAGGGPVDFRPVITPIIEALPNLPTRPTHQVPDVSAGDLSEYAGDYYYGVFCHTLTPQDQANGAWLKGENNRVTLQKNGLQIRNEFYIPYDEDLFVESNGKRLLKFGRDSQGDVSHFCYSTSPDTFEKDRGDFPEYDSLAQEVYELTQENKVAQALELVQTEKTGNRFYIREAEFNNVGYALLNQDRIADAVSVFQLNAELHPNSWNVYDSLGEALIRLGKNEKAIEAYTRSIELNSNNEAGKEQLRKLRAKR